VLAFSGTSPASALREGDRRQVSDELEDGFLEADETFVEQSGEAAGRETRCRAKGDLPAITDKLRPHTLYLFNIRRIFARATTTVCSSASGLIAADREEVAARPTPTERTPHAEEVDRRHAHRRAGGALCSRR
jgi:hypothetical protein